MFGWPLKNRCERWIHHGIVIFCLAMSARAAEPMIITSASKQFAVRGLPQHSVFRSASGDIIYADPALMAMACERVREAVQQELGLNGRWRDSIFVDIHPASGRKEKPNIQAISTGGGWRYRVNIPDEVSRRDFLGPLVEVLLLEYANRGARETSVEIPTWLLEGMTEHLMAGPLSALALQPNTFVVRTKYSDDAAPVLRRKVQARGALTVDQLNWPEFDSKDFQAVEAYRTSAHLFVRELLHLRGGPESLAAMLALLPENLNWQTAFFRAFDSRFTRVLDVEKWWSLVVVQARMHERNQAWPAAESQARLEEILYTPMQVRLKKDELPHVTPVALQTLLSESTFREQAPILRAKINQLAMLRGHVSPEFAALADQYRGAIERYLAARFSKKLATKDASSRQVRSLLKTVTAELQALDDRRTQVASRVLTASAEGANVPAAAQAQVR